MRPVHKGGTFEALLDALAPAEKSTSSPQEQVGDRVPAKDAIRGTPAARVKEELKGAAAIDTMQTHVHRGRKKASRHAVREADSRATSGSTLETKVAETTARPEANDVAQTIAESSAKLPNAHAAAFPAKPKGDSADGPAAPSEIVTAKNGDSVPGEIRLAAAEIGPPLAAAQGVAEASVVDAAATKIAGQLPTAENSHTKLKAEQEGTALPAAGQETSAIDVAKEDRPAATAAVEARSDGDTARQESHAADARAEDAAKLPAVRKSSRDEGTFASEARKAHGAAESVSTVAAVSGANECAPNGGTAAAEVARDGTVALMPMAVVSSQPAAAATSHTADSSNVVRESAVSASSTHALVESSGIASSVARTAAGGGELKVSVHLSELGKVEIRAVATRESTTAHITASNREAVHALATERGELELALKSRDAILGSLDAQSGGYPAPQQHQQGLRSQAVPDRGSADEAKPEQRSAEEEAEDSRSLAAHTSLNIRV